MINPLSAIMAFVVLVVYVVKERTSSTPERVAKPKEESKERVSSRPANPSQPTTIRPFVERPVTPIPVFSRQDRLEESSFGLRSRSNLRPKTKEVGTQSFIEAPSMTVEEPSVVGKAAMCCGACLSALALRPLKKVFKMAGEQAVRREKSQRRGKSDKTDRILDNFSDEEGSNSISRKRLLANRALRESAAQGKLSHKLRDELHSDFKESVSPPSSNQFRHRDLLDRPTEPTHVAPQKTIRELSSFTPESKEIPEPSKTNVFTSNPFASNTQKSESLTTPPANLFAQNSNETEKKTQENAQPSLFSKTEDKPSLFPKADTSATNLFLKTETSTSNPFAKTESQPSVTEPITTNTILKTETTSSLFPKSETQSSNPFAKSETQAPLFPKIGDSSLVPPSNDSKPSLFPSTDNKTPLFPSTDAKPSLFPSTDVKQPLFPTSENKPSLIPKVETPATNPFAPATPAQTTNPFAPATPAQTTNPFASAQNSNPFAPATPAQTTNPFAPATPAQTTNPFASAQNSNPFAPKPSTGVSEEAKPKENLFAQTINSSNLFDGITKPNTSPFAVPSPAAKPESAPFTSSGTAPLFGTTSASSLFPQTSTTPLFSNSTPTPVLDTKAPLFPMQSSGGQTSSLFPSTQDSKNISTPSPFNSNPFQSANPFETAKPAENIPNFFQTQNVSSGTQMIHESKNPFTSTPTPSSNPFQPNNLFGQTPPPSTNPIPSSENSFFSKAADPNNSNPFINSAKNQNKHGLSSLIGSGSGMFSK